MIIFEACERPVVIRGRAFSCGQCLLCRRQRMFEWILRGKHQLQSVEGKATFVTLTYKAKCLPREGFDGLPIEKRCAEDACGNLNPIDMTLFIKRLRRWAERNLQRKFKMMYCGEYGTLRWRPHYHMVIFGISPEEIPAEVYTKLWGKGKVDVSPRNVTAWGIQYVVGYCSKKMLDRATKKSEYEQKGRLAPYLRTSKGFGKEWAMRHMEEIIKMGCIPDEDREAPIPRYYIKIAKRTESICIPFTVTTLQAGKPDIVRKDKKYIENPWGKLTQMIESWRIKRIEQQIKEAEENTENKFYFETLNYLLRNRKAILQDIHRKIVIWKQVRKEDISTWTKVLSRKTMKTVKDLLDADEDYQWRANLKEKRMLAEATENFDKDLINYCRENVRLKIDTIMSGYYGKRMKLDEAEIILNENFEN